MHDVGVGLRIFVAHPSALLTDHRPHGDGLVAYGFIRGLAERGHELHVAAQEVDLREPPPPNVHVYRAGGGAGAALGRIAFMAGMRRLYGRLARIRRIDVVHQLNPVDVGLSLALAGVDAPLVLGPYVPDWPEAGHSRLKAGIRFVQQRQATTALLSTPAAASKLSPRLRASLHVHRISGGIDTSLWHPPPTTAGEPEHDVLFLANLHARKGLPVLLDAFARLAHTAPDARLLVAGDGPLRGEVERRVESDPALGGVRLHGAVARSEVRSLMWKSAVYCLPSLGEPFGMSALEAMACGRPVVGTDAGGLAYLLSDRGGRRVPPGDPEALARALGGLIAAPELQRSMGEHNRRLVETDYTWARSIDRLEEAYAEAMSRPRRRRTW